MPSLLFPDEEALVCDFLRRQPTISSIVADRVGTRLFPTFPCIRVTSLGGSTPEWYQWDASVQIEVWADNLQQAAAKTLALAIVATVYDLDVTWDNTQLSSATIRNGPLYIPDPDTQRPRYIIDLELVLHQGAVS